jgi:hypothetical protein
MRGNTHQQEAHEGENPDVCPTGHGRRSFHVIDPILDQPMADLDECEDGKQRGKLHVEFIPKHRHRQACFHDCLAHPLVYALHLRLP